MKKLVVASQSKLKQEVAKLRGQLAEAHEALRAIQSGEVDALVVSGAQGAQIFTLQSADQPYRILMETMSEGAVTLSQDGTIFYCNQRFSEMLQTSLESLIGTSFLACLAPADVSAFELLFEQGKKGRSKATLPLKSRLGQRVPTHLSMSAVEIEGGPGVCLLATDMTAHHQFEESQADVERLNIERDLRERFVSTLSHDLRNPLAAAKINTQMILRYLDRPKNIPPLGARIIKSIDRADMMIQNLLDANRIRAGELLPLESERCDLREITRELLEELNAVHGDRFVLKAPRPVLGVWSPGQLRRVIENLASNAVKYGSDQTSVTVKLQEEGKFVTLSVHNQGSYLTPLERSGLFRQYNRTPSAIASGKRGWGLGLTLVRGVIEAHGGKVDVVSSKDKGTTFLVRLPK